MLFKKVLAIPVIMVMVLCCSFLTFAQAASLDKAMVTFTIDDGEKSLWTTVYPILDKYGFKATCGIVTGWVGDGTHVTWPQNFFLFWKDWEIACHGDQHSHLDVLTLDQIKADTEMALQKFWDQGLIVVKAYVSPYGERVNDPSLNALLSDLGFESNRRAWTETSPFNQPADFNRWAINVVPIKRDTNVNSIIALIDQAVAAKAWVEFVVHGVVATPTDPDQVATAKFQQVVNRVQYWKSAGKLDVVTTTKAVQKMTRYQNMQ